MLWNYRLWQEADLPSVLEILNALDHSAFGQSGNWSLAQLREEFKTGKGWVCTDEHDCPVAFLALRDLGEKEWEVTNLAVREDVRGRGIMKTLWGQFLGILTPPFKIFLEVHEKNMPARALYGKLGFQFSGRRKKYYRDGGDALLYCFSKV